MLILITYTGGEDTVCYTVLPLLRYRRQHLRHPLLRCHHCNTGTSVRCYEDAGRDHTGEVVHVFSMLSCVMPVRQLVLMFLVESLQRNKRHSISRKHPLGSQIICLNIIRPRIKTQAYNIRLTENVTPHKFYKST
jgi:hypothetical protein